MASRSGRRRSRHRGRPGAVRRPSAGRAEIVTRPVGSAVPEEDTSPADDAEGSSDLVLVEVEPGTAIAFGSGDLSRLGMSPMPPLYGAQRDNLISAATQAASLLNVGGQGAAGLLEARGLVKLAPETLSHLRSGAQTLPMEGWFGGTLRGADGKWSHSVRWAPAGSAGAIRVAASLGSAVAAMGLQMQLSQIAKVGQRTLNVANRMLAIERGQQWAEVDAHHSLTLAEMNNAVVVGSVTDSIWQHLQAQSSEAALRSSRLALENEVRRSIAELGATHGGQPKLEWLNLHGEAALRDVTALIRANWSWYAYQAMRVNYLRGKGSDEDTLLVDHLAAVAAEEYDVAAKSAATLLTAVHRHFMLMQKCPGAMGLTISGRKRTPREVGEIARSLAEQAELLAGSKEALDPANVTPRIAWVDPKGARDDIGSRLRWVLLPSEELIGVSYGSMGRWGFLEWGYIVLTERRLICLKDSTFPRNGIVDFDRPWSSFASMTVGERGAAGGPDVVLKGADEVTLQFCKQMSVERTRVFAAAVQPMLGSEEERLRRQRVLSLGC